MPPQIISMLGKPALCAHVALSKIHRRSKIIFGEFVSELCPEILLMPGNSSAESHAIRSVQ